MKHFFEPVLLFQEPLAPIGLNILNGQKVITEFQAQKPIPGLNLKTWQSLYLYFYQFLLLCYLQLKLHIYSSEKLNQTFRQMVIQPKACKALLLNPLKPATPLSFYNYAWAHHDSWLLTLGSTSCFYEAGYSCGSSMFSFSCHGSPYLFIASMKGSGFISSTL